MPEDLTTVDYKVSANIVNDACVIIESSQKAAFSAVNIALIQRNWLLGKRISEEIIGEDNRADYGVEVIKKLSKELTSIYGKGFDRRSLYYCLEFYRTYPEIVHSLSAKSSSILSWTHYRVLLQVKDPVARQWYENESYNETWSVRTLQRNIDSQYYYRIIKSQIKQPVIDEMHALTKDFQNNKLAHYSVLKGNEQLFASKYKLYLPTEEELRAEIEAQKTIYLLQHNTDSKNGVTDESVILI